MLVLTFYASSSYILDRPKRPTPCVLLMVTDRSTGEVVDKVITTCESRDIQANLTLLKSRNETFVFPENEDGIEDDVYILNTMEHWEPSKFKNC